MKVLGKVVVSFLSGYAYEQGRALGKKANTDKSRAEFKKKLNDLNQSALQKALKLAMERAAARASEEAIRQER
jgi:hypothetical protein